MASVIRGSGTSSLGGDLDIEGVLTYEDVASVDSIGIVTARSGLHVGTGTSISSPSSNVLTLGTNNEERLRVTSAGLVGIGTDDPDELLEVGDGSVSGALKISGQSSSITSDGFTVDWESSSNSTRFFSEPSSGGSSAIRFFTTNSGTRAEKLHIASDGRLTSTRSTTTAYDAAATTNNSNAVILNNGAAGHATLQFQSLSGGTAQTGQATISSFNESSGSKNTALTFGTRQDSDSTVRERLRITSAGYVGIGTDNPQYELDVTGNIRNTGHHIFGSSGMCVSSPYTVVSNGGTFDFTVPGTSVCGYVYLISSLISNAAVTTRRSYFFGSRLGNNPVLTPEHTNNGISGSPSFTFAHLNNNVLRYTSSQAGDVTVTIGFLGIMGF